MTLYDLWMACPQTHVFFKPEQGVIPQEYEGQPYGKITRVLSIQAKRFPDYGAVVVADVVPAEVEAND